MKTIKITVLLLSLSCVSVAKGTQTEKDGLITTRDYSPSQADLQVWYDEPAATVKVVDSRCLYCWYRFWYCCSNVEVKYVPHQ